MGKVIKILVIWILLFTIVSCSEIGNIDKNIDQADNILKQNIDKRYGIWTFQKAVLRAEKKAGEWWNCYFDDIDDKTKIIYFGCNSPFIEGWLNWTYDYKKVWVIIVTDNK